MNKNIKIVSPIRFFLFILISTMILVFSFVGVFSITQTEASSYDTYVQVEVAENDTLWEIASDYAEGSVDIRTIVKDICEINEIQSGDIKAGDKIFVPIY